MTEKEKHAFELLKETYSPNDPFWIRIGFEWGILFAKSKDEYHMRIKIITKGSK